jgi:hypothetical protein
VLSRLFHYSYQLSAVSYQLYHEFRHSSHTSEVKISARLQIMNASTDSQELGVASFQTQIEAISTAVRETAERSTGDTIALLALLRTLEALHREVCNHQFQPALPNNRQALYALLRDIESQGGWPYIARMKLQAFLNHDLEDNASDDGASG